MTTYKTVTKAEILEMISRLQCICYQELMLKILNKEYSNVSNDSIKLLKDLRRQSGLDILHTARDLFLIRYTY